MKSKIGLEHIISHRAGRITHAVPETPATEPDGEAKTAPPIDPARLVPVVVHVDKEALEGLLQKE
ncbi:MAG TPA: hypothetical protein VHP13_12035 [Gammaproteobacteria bacterium]|jgi:hypothetical protein|nr:hypothetical protein [Gammaproteobacteria bacterium]